MDRVYGLSLPAEMWARILGFLPANKQSCLKRVSRAWRELIEGNARGEVRRLRYERQLEGMSWATTLRVLRGIHLDFALRKLHVRCRRYNVGSCRSTQALLTTFGGRQRVLSFRQDRMMSIWDPVSGQDVSGNRMLPYLGHCRVSLGIRSLWYSRCSVRAVASGSIDGKQMLFRYLETGIVETWNLDREIAVFRMVEALGDNPLLQFHCFEGRAFLVSDTSLRGIRVWQCRGPYVLRRPFVESGSNVFTAISNGLVAINAKGDMQQWSPFGGTQKLGTGLPRARHLAVLGETPLLQLGIGTLGGNVAIWAGETQMCEGKHSGAVTALISASLCGRQLLISGGHDGYILFHDKNTGAQLTSINRKRSIQSMIAIPHNKLFILIVGSLDSRRRGRVEVLGFNRS